MDLASSLEVSGTRNYPQIILLKFNMEGCRQIYETISVFSYIDPVECLFYITSWMDLSITDKPLYIFCFHYFVESVC